MTVAGACFTTSQRSRMNQSASKMACRRASYLRIVGKDGRRAITLVDVQIHNGHTLHVGMLARPRGSNREVIQDRETGSKGGVRVVSATTQVGSESMAQGEVGCEHSARTF